MLTRDERRFKTADRDGDGIATREEFTAFLHPEEYDYMRGVVVQVGATLKPPRTLLSIFSHASNLVDSVPGAKIGCNDIKNECKASIATSKWTANVYLDRLLCSSGNVSCLMQR